MGKFQKTKEKKQTRKYLRLTITGILVVLLAVMPMLASRNAEGDASQASILSATVEHKDIDTQIIGGGQLSSEASLNIRIPENVKLTQYLVGNGGTVKEGEPIAKVDKVSVMTAITEVQETLDYLAEEIAAASGDTASTSVKALAGGTVKVIYAREGESVQDVMLKHGALAVLSLDDTMAVKIEKETNLDVGDTVCVTLADGTKVDGRVKTNLEGVLTVTLDDDDYSVGAKVTVSTESGEELGTGELYVFSPWSATAYSGTISDVLVAENDTVAIGRVLFSLEDTGNSAQFQRLIDQRQEYEELMQELFTMYRTETITAPCDGIVTGVDEDGAYLLADDGDGWFVNLLSFFGPEKDGFVAYAVTVTEVTASGTELRIDPKAMYIEKDTFADYISTLANVSGVEIKTFEDLKKALVLRMDHFKAHGCKISDHGLEYLMYREATAEEVEAIFAKKMSGQALTKEEELKYKTAFMIFVGREYNRLGWAMQLHYGIIRDNDKARFAKLGPDTGFDSINNYAPSTEMGFLLNALALTNELPKTILYSLNPNDNAAIGTMIGCFQDSSTVGKIQQGSAWWFNDHKTGMTEQMISLANLGLLSNFVGMLTDSRSFLSYTRHEYFRRIACELIGGWVDNGEYPADEKALEKIIKGLSYNNAVRYFEFDLETK